MDFNLTSLGLVIFLGGFSIGEGEADGRIIATADVEVSWIGKDKVGGKYINVRVSWVDIMLKLVEQILMLRSVEQHLKVAWVVDIKLFFYGLILL